MASEEFTKRLREDLIFVMDAKADMLNRGLLAGWRKCPRCGAKVHFRLMGRRRHLRAACDTKGCISVIE